MHVVEINPAVKGCHPRSQSAGEEFDKLCEQLEKEEIEAPNGVPPVHVYQQLLAIYLLQNDLTAAKFLWQRIPASSKSSSAVLALIWGVGQKLWQRDFEGLYGALSSLSSSTDLSSELRKMTEMLHNQIVKRSIDLVSVAYTSIRLEDFSILVGMSKEESLDKAKSLEWAYDEPTNMITPIMPPTPPYKSMPSEEQMRRLTEYVSFLEN